MTEPSPPAPSFVELFRLAAPYVHAHRGRTFVVMFGGEAVIDHDFPHLVQDLALVHSLGVRLVLVHGSKPQIERRLRERKIPLRFAGDVRVTDRATMSCVEDAVGHIRGRIEGLFSMGLPSSPMAAGGTPSPTSTPPMRPHAAVDSQNGRAEQRSR